MPPTQDSRPRIAVIGAGPAGLAAAEAAAEAGASVTLFERMPSPARKFLLAGRGGLNLTHSEPLDRFLARYADADPRLLDAVRAFPPEAVARWCEGLGQPVFTGSSGRVFPVAMKASPLLRAWLARLDALGVTLRARHRWAGFGADGALRFDTPDGPVTHRADAVVLALGGASWPRLGADAAWVAALPRVPVALFVASNCGVRIAWPDGFRARFAGAPLKRIALACGDAQVRGEAIVTDSGLEGGAVYALSAPIRAALAATGEALLTLDLRPDLDAAALSARLDGPRGARSLGNHLRVAGGLPPVASALLREAPDDRPLSARVKALPLRVTGLAGLERAISSAGGVAWEALDDRFMLRAHPGVFAAGEMLGWDAPTGGYLLTACLATGRAAARGALSWCAGLPPPSADPLPHA